MHDDVDRILNDGLATYSAVEPPAGMLQQLWCERRLARSFSSARWLGAAALAAAAGVIAFFMLPPEPSRLTTAAVRTPQPPPLVAPIAPEHRAVVHAAPPPPRRPAEPPAAPKLDQFPSPVPLSREEAALIALARNHPEQLAPLRAELKPIQIEEIQITPLETGSDKETRQE
jgi:hypothetical protein